MNANSIFTDPEIIRLNREVCRLAAIIIKDGEASLNEGNLKPLRLLCQYHAMCAVYDLAETLRQLDTFPEVQAVKADFCARFGVTFPTI